VFWDNSARLHRGCPEGSAVCCAGPRTVPAAAGGLACCHVSPSCFLFSFIFSLAVISLVIEVVVVWTRRCRVLLLPLPIAVAITYRLQGLASRTAKRHARHAHRAWCCNDSW
jgi:hypothetical protein